MFQFEARAKALRFDVLVDGEYVAYIVADIGKIRQVLINLLGNAIKFTSRGQVTLHITLQRKGADQLWLSAQVQDTGCGIANEEQENLEETEIMRRHVNISYDLASQHLFLSHAAQILLTHHEFYERIHIESNPASPRPRNKNMALDRV